MKPSIRKEEDKQKKPSVRKEEDKQKDEAIGG